MHQNVTLKLDTVLLRKAKIYATKEGSSLSRLMTKALGQIVGSTEKYEKAKGKALSLLKKGFRLGGGPYYSSRDELHHRHAR